VLAKPLWRFVVVSNYVPKYVNPKNVKKLMGELAPFGVRHFLEALDFALAGFEVGANFGTIFLPNPNAEANSGNRTVRIAHMLHSPLWTSDHGFDGQKGIVTSLMRMARRDDGKTFQVGASDKRFMAFDFPFYVIMNLRPGEESCVGGVRKREKVNLNTIRPMLLNLRFYKEQDHEWEIVIPLRWLLQGFVLKKHGHMGYLHSAQVGDTNYFYAGVTSRHWLTRMGEHIRGIRTGEPKLFYNAWRLFSEQDKRVIFRSTLAIVNAEYEEIMAWEEAAVDKYMGEGRSVNAIPGGFKGIRELYKLGLLADKSSRDITARDKAIDAFQRVNPRAGIPNLLLRDLWKDADFAERVICSHPDRLSVDQIHEVRRLAVWGIPIEKIVEKVGARNADQVKRVLSGKTYSRIH
jgi:hypothetical protein